MQENALPHQKIIYVCCNARAEGERVCCASRGGVELHARLKELVKERGLRTKVRVSKSGCMDRCEEGANVMIFPDNVWLSHVVDSDLAAIIDRVARDVSLRPE